MRLDDESYYKALEEFMALLVPMPLAQYEEFMANLIDIKTELHKVDHMITINNIELVVNGLKHISNIHGLKLVEKDK